MKKQLLPLLGIGLLLLTGISSYGQKNDKATVKKVRILPVYLVYSGFNYDTSIDRMVKEAFTRHKVELIDAKKFEQLNEGEVRRVETKFRLQNNNFNSERDVREAIAREQQFASNFLLITFSTDNTDDTLRVISADWESTAYPPNINSPRSSGKQQTTLTDTCCSVQDNIFALVDKILYSKWLK